ncbi:flagellar biosynthetic protein FliR [Buchnera aphidicola (Periphyllus koelreuteriae)]|uniref:flagellar biosynthetic protein FliR n=1 Tax=Buchnera aphidicola TaxID=9 RepID=UPI0031B8196C
MSLNINDYFFIFINILYPSIRIFFFFYIVSIFNSNYFNMQTKIFLSFIISLIILPFIPLFQFNIFSLDGVLILLEQILIGILIGFSINLIFSISNVSGEIFSFQTGLSFSNFFNENVFLKSSIMSCFLNSLIIILFLSLDGHLWMISTIIKSFYIFPISFKFFDINILISIVKLFSLIFVNGIYIIFPIIIILFFLNLSLCFLNKFIPQLSIFSIGFSIINFFGIFSFFIFLFHVLFFLDNYLNKIYFKVLNIIFF